MAGLINAPRPVSAPPIAASPVPRHRPCVARSADLTLAKRPDSRDGAHERALARPGRAPQKDCVAALEREIHIRDERLTIGEMEIHPLHCYVSSAAIDTPDASFSRRPDAHAL